MLMLILASLNFLYVLNYIQFFICVVFYTKSLFAFSNRNFDTTLTCGTSGGGQLVSLPDK